MGLLKTPTMPPQLSFGPSPRHKNARRRHGDEEVDELLNYEPKKKRVRFSSDSKGSLKWTECASEIVHSDLDKPKLWWTRRERASILDECHDAIKDFRTDNTGQVQHYLDVFDKCCDSLSPSSSDYIEQARFALPTDARGLEWGWAPQTKNHRREHVKDVLEVQERVKNLSAPMREKLLSSRSLRSSRRCLLMARLLGEGDHDEETPRKRHHRDPSRL